jgi:penicillin-binding protein 1A
MLLFFKHLFKINPIPMMNIRLNKNKIIIFLILISGVICGSLAGAFFALTHDLPQIRSLENFKPDAVTRIYSSDKVLLTELFIEKREPVPLEAIPRLLKAALVATEDRKFGRRKHHHSAVVENAFSDASKNICAQNKRGHSRLSAGAPLH